VSKPLLITIGENTLAIETILFITNITVSAVETGIRDATYSYVVTYLYFLYFATYFKDSANHLMSWNTGESRDTQVIVSIVDV